jgi:hypothetical protein
MTGWEELKIRFHVEQSKHVDTGVPRWMLVMSHTGRDGGFIVQRWDHEPTQEEIEKASFAATQGANFLTSHLACERPQRKVEVIMPRIRMKIVDTGPTEKKVDPAKIAEALGAKHVGTIKTGPGYFGAAQAAALKEKNDQFELAKHSCICNPRSRLKPGETCQVCGGNE